MLTLAAFSLTLVAPVAGPVERPFAYGADPFRAGWHRGADFRAAPGAPVRAACSGRVVWAGRDVVTVRCAGYRVTHLPLSGVAVARGARVRAGTRVGRVARSRGHTGLHLGVRHAHDRFGYVDPVPLLAAPPGGVPAAPRVGRPPPRAAPPAGAPPAASPRAAPAGAPRAAAPAAAPAPAPRAAPPAVRVLAPWPAWLGLAVLLAGALGGGVRIGVRRRRAPVAASVRR
jgi:hypothetical protein